MGAAARDRTFESTRVHGWLRAAILAVELQPGAMIAESEIAARFGTSRTPVREALLRLADEGLVEIRPQRGTYVARMSLARIEEALFVRAAVEGAVLQRIAAREDMAPLARALAAIVDAQAHAVDARDTPAALDADTAFHRALVEASGLPGVWDVVARARDLHHRLRAIALPQADSARRAIADHRAIVRALRAGDGAAAIARMAAHLARNLALARAIARRNPGYFEEAAPAATPTSRARAS
ncbi:MAG: GntR family transcriptional regulator [Burkholderiales bacterium]